MENFKIVNRNTGATYFLNSQEYATFVQRNSFFKDGVCQYDEYNLTKEKARRINKMLDVVAHFCIIGASILATLIYIQNY